MERTKNMIEVQHMTSHPYVTSGEQWVMNIVVEYLDFPMEELQEHEKAHGHIDLVLYQFPVEVLHGLQISVK
jgi:hypothetical protein